MIRKGLLLSLIPLAVIIGLGLWGYQAAEPGQRFPVHWGLDGRPDRFGGPTEAFLGLPAVAVALTLLFAFAPRLLPRDDDLRRSGPAYLTGWLAGLWLLTALQLGMTLTALGVWSSNGDHFTRWLAASLAVFFALVGNVLGKARPNWIVGVRTPWTLSSDYTWDRTHRVAGRSFVATGIVGLMGALVLPVDWAAPVVVLSVLVASGWAVVHSYLIWREAPDRGLDSQAGPRRQRPR